VVGENEAGGNDRAAIARENTLQGVKELNLIFEFVFSVRAGPWVELSLGRSR
jgi:hypothetical protein